MSSLLRTCKSISKKYDEQNVQLNNCVQVSLRMINAKNLAFAQAIHNLQCAELSATQQRLAKIHIEEPTACKDNINSMLDEMQRMYVEQRDTKFTDTNIEKLNKAGAPINESDELLKGVKHLIGGTRAAQSEAASSRG